MLNTFSLRNNKVILTWPEYEMSTNPQTTFSILFVPTCTYTKITRNDKMAKKYGLKMNKTSLKKFGRKL